MFLEFVCNCFLLLIFSYVLSRSFKFKRANFHGWLCSETILRPLATSGILGIRFISIYPSLLGAAYIWSLYISILDPYWCHSLLHCILLRLWEDSSLWYLQELGFSWSILVRRSLLHYILLLRLWEERSVSLASENSRSWNAHDYYLTVTQFCHIT